MEKAIERAALQPDLDGSERERRRLIYDATTVNDLINPACIVHMPCCAGMRTKPIASLTTLAEGER